MDLTSFQVAFVGLGLMYPDVQITARQPLAQAVIESGNFTSHVWQVNNNCLGMMAPSARETTCTNKGQGGYAHYDSPLDCICDLFLWCRAMGIKNDADLDAFVKAGRYAKDPGYYKKVQAEITALAHDNKYLSKAAILGVAGLTAGGVTMAAVYGASKILRAI